MRSLPDGGEAPYELNSTWFDLVGAGREEDEAIELHLATHAAMLAMRGIPALYVHSLFGTANDPRISRRRAGLGRSTGASSPISLRSTVAGGTDVESLGCLGRRRANGPASDAAHPAFHPDADQRIAPAPPSVFRRRADRTRTEAGPGWT